MSRQWGDLTEANLKIASFLGERPLQLNRKEKAKKMLKQFLMVKRKPDISFGEYKKYYLDNHAPLVMKYMPEIRRYKVNLAIQRGKPTLFDSIAEMYWDDLETLIKVAKSETYKNIIVPDEKYFLDRETIKVLLTEEYIQR